MSYKHVLLAVDLTNGYKEIALRAAEVAKALQAKLSLVHAVVPVPVYSNPELDRLEEERIDFARKELTQLADQLKVPREGRHIRLGSTKKVILDVTAESDVDLIIVGSHSHHGLSRLLGSTASGVVSHAPCDVLTLRYDIPNDE